MAIKKLIGSYVNVTAKIRMTSEIKEKNFILRNWPQKFSHLE